jgi:Rrf2 family protein
MQLTRAADYAVRVMIHMAGLPHGARVSLTTLVDATGAPDSFLSKILQALTRARMITSRRGPAGGFQLSIRGRKSSMRAIMEAIDGPMNLNVCLAEGRTCPRKSRCPAHPVWVKAQGALLDVLNNSLITDLSAQGKGTG